MVKSMTGYGKAECTIKDTKYTIEVRSVNGKNADITIKTNLLPREKEMETRAYLISELGRGSIDLFITKESSAQNSAKHINKELIKEYYSCICDAFEGTPMQKRIIDPDDSFLINVLMKMPDVVDAGKSDFEEDDWSRLRVAIHEAVAALNSFREKEGIALKVDILNKVNLIESYIPEVEKYEKQRVETIKDRIWSRMSEIVDNPDMNRFEQEMIFYLEKLDINEEKVRLRQHCNYFRETLNNDPMPGKKLGFIAQEMGREINTLGSKANQADIQKWVVKMKDELEKIKEQSLNIL